MSIPPSVGVSVVVWWVAPIAEKSSWQNKFLTWTKLFAAQKSGFLFAVPIIPSPVLCEIRKAVLTRVLPRLLHPIEFSPICELPRTSVCPFPISLRCSVRTSNPEMVISLFQLFYNVAVDSIRGNRCQVATFLFAMLFRPIPRFWHWAPVEAVIPVLLPVFLALLNAFCVITAPLLFRTWC